MYERAVRAFAAKVLNQSPTPNASSQPLLFGTVVEGGIQLDAPDTLDWDEDTQPTFTDATLLEDPDGDLVNYAEYQPGDRVALSLDSGGAPVVVGREGGLVDSDLITTLQQGQDAAADALVEQSLLVANHKQKLEEQGALVQGIKASVDATDGVVAGLTDQVGTVSTQADQAVNLANLAREFAQGLVDMDSAEPPVDPPVGQVWVPRDEEGNATGLWRFNGEAWETVSNLVGLRLSVGADGALTLVGADGVEASQEVAEILRTKVLYADVAGVKTLVVTDIPRENLAADVGEALDTADALGSRIILDGPGGTLTIARNRPTPSAPLTATVMSATGIDFIAADRTVGYFDSDKEQMTATNVLVTGAFQVGSHLARDAGNGVTIFQQVQGV